MLPHERRCLPPGVAHLVRHPFDLVANVEGCKVKRPTPRKAEPSDLGQGASIVSPGSLPARKATVTADVLSRLLSGQKLTGLDAVAISSTTRLAAVVHSLTRDYGWTIESTDKATGCRDGRVAWVAEYWITREVSRLAFAAGAGVWCVAVKAARLTARANAARASQQARKANDAARRFRGLNGIPHQPGLFGDEGQAAS